MRNTELRKVIALLQDRFPDYRNKGSIFFRTPVQHLLGSFIFESSSFNRETFYVTAFVQPLYVPSSYVTLSFGHRLRGDWRFENDRIEELSNRLVQPMLNAAKDMIESMLTPVAFADRACEAFSCDNPHCNEALAYSLLLAGRTNKGLEAIDAACMGAENLLKTNQVAWPLELRTRVLEIKKLALRSNEHAVQQLVIWESRTVRDLGLSEWYRKPSRD